MNARKSVALIAAQVCTLSLVAAAQAGANPHMHGYNPPFRPMRPIEHRSTGNPGQGPRVVHVEPQHGVVPGSQQFLYVPGYVPLAFPTFSGFMGSGFAGYGMGSGFMGDGSLGLQSPCRSHQGMTLGELAPGGNSSFAPVTQEMIGATAPSSSNWLSVLAGVTPLTQSSPWQAPPSNDLHCTSPQNDLPDLNIGN